VAVQARRHAISVNPQGLRHSARAATQGASHRFCCSMQVRIQPGAAVACEAVSANAANVATIHSFGIEYPLRAPRDRRPPRYHGPRQEAAAAQQALLLPCRNRRKTKSR
jgi:hypothetical protein